MNPQAYLDLVHHDRDVFALLATASQSSAPRKDCTDWQCTLLFYMACISVKCFAATTGLAIQDHYQLRSWLNNQPALLGVARSYRKLEERSRDARYEGRRYSAAEMDQNKRWFGEVHQAVIALLRAGPLPRATPVAAF